MSDKLEALVRELFQITDSVECSDENRYFFPTEIHFSSCRIMNGQRIGAILDEMKQIVGAPARKTEKEMHLLNYPDDCGECLGTGLERKYQHCKACGGTGSTDPEVTELICPTCEGTGDTQNHERESNDCDTCDRTGRIKKKP